jgi:hypothetical protein
MVLITIVTWAYKPTYNWGPHIVSKESAIAWKKEGYSHLRWIFTIAIIFGELTIAIINHDCPKITIIILSSNVASWIRNLNVKFDDFPKTPPYWPDFFQLVTFDYWIFENELEKYDYWKTSWIFDYWIFDHLIIMSREMVNMSCTFSDFLALLRKIQIPILVPQARFANLANSPGPAWPTLKNDIRHVFLRLRCCVCDCLRLARNHKWYQMDCLRLATNHKWYQMVYNDVLYWNGMIKHFGGTVYNPSCCFVSQFTWIRFGAIRRSPTRRGKYTWSTFNWGASDFWYVCLNVIEDWVHKK